MDLTWHTRKFSDEEPYSSQALGPVLSTRDRITAYPNLPLLDRPIYKSNFRSRLTMFQLILRICRLIRDRKRRWMQQTTQSCVVSLSFTDNVAPKIVPDNCLMLLNLIVLTYETL